MEELLASIADSLVALGKGLFAFMFHYPDWAIYWAQWITIAYSLFLLAYNCGLKFVRALKKSKPRRWARLAPLWLRQKRKDVAFFVVRRLPRLLGLLGRRAALVLWFYGTLAWRWCCWGWGAFVAYRRGAAGALGELWRSLDREAWASFKENLELPHLGRLVWNAGRAFFYGYRDALRGHGRFIGESAETFLSRPFTQEWTIFRFFKHLLGITFGISFFYYAFLWCAYALYICWDFIFLFIRITCLDLLQPIFFPMGVPKRAFLRAYKRVLKPLEFFILVGLFELLPARVKALKDRIFPEAFFWRKVVRPGLVYLERLLWRWAWKARFFVTVTGYYQTRYFVRQLGRLFFYFWRRRHRYRRRLGKLMPWALYSASKQLLGRMATRLWWLKARFFVRDVWRWFSFVWRRYLLLPPWRRLQYGYKKWRLRFHFKLRFWALWLDLLEPLLFWGCLLAVPVVLFYLL